MSDSSAESAIFQELESLFAWNPLLFSLATKKMGGSFSTNTRDPAWYDMHLAPDRICTRLVHVKDLHKRIAAVVDDKLRKIREDGITLEPLTVMDFPRKAVRDMKSRHSKEAMKEEKCLQQYYCAYTAEFCLPIASTLTLAPSRLDASSIYWTMLYPLLTGDPICNGSLQVMTGSNSIKRQLDGTTKLLGPSDDVDPDLWHRIDGRCTRSMETSRHGR